ncbi:hypothetical protein H181DRAFT_03421 [Streptomyces sp. WMMB 714]|nr:hypothetical protein H181DRAFT_03421 [Streptomyces sp. WMMB 714]
MRERCVSGQGARLGCFPGFHGTVRHRRRAGHPGLIKPGLGFRLFVFMGCVCTQKLSGIRLGYREVGIGSRLVYVSAVMVIEECRARAVWMLAPARLPGGEPPPPASRIPNLTGQTRGNTPGRCEDCPGACHCVSPAEPGAGGVASVVCGSAHRGRVSSNAARSRTSATCTPPPVKFELCFER